MKENKKLESELYYKAIALSEDRVQLKKRLNETKSILLPELKKKFKNCKFDFKNKCLIGDGYILQWKVRAFPAAPVSYYNQQTNTGEVIVKQINETK